MNVFLMQNSIVRPLGRDMQNVLIGFVGEHEARTFFVRTRDDLSGYTVGLVIGDIDCGAMTKAPMPDGSIMLSLTLTSDMLGKGGDKVCQLLMTKDTIVRKSSQFRAYVGASNDINSTAPDSATIIIISEKITELVHEAALDAIAEVQEVIDSIPADYSELSAQVDTNTEDISGLKADLGALGTDMPGVQEKSFYTSRASSSGTTHGIAYTFNNTTYTVTESGTATANAYVNIIGSNSVIPSALSKGRKYKLVWNSTDENIFLQIAVKDSGGNTLSGGISGVSPIEFEIPQNAYGLIVRTVVYSGATVDGVISDFHFEGAVSENLKPSGDTSDRTAEILKILNKIGSCRLESGVYYVSGLVMPEGTDLKGAGKSTVLRLIDSDESEEVCAIKMGRHCTVSDLSIIGADSDITLPETEGKRVGILFSADDNTDVTTTTVRGNVKGVYVSRMTGSGIKCYNTGYSSSGNANWSNLWIWNCYNGINIDYFSEYHHFSCFNVSSCKYGVVCNGGNNIFSCGSLTANENGFRLDNVNGDKPNNGHGSCVGLNINHNNGTSGQAVYINDCGSGFLFLGCHISQGEIALTKVGGVIFSACHFGSSARVTITNGWGILFNGCTSSGSLASPNPTVSITNNTATRFLDCFYKGGALWTVCAPSAESLDARITALENA